MQRQLSAAISVYVIVVGQLTFCATSFLSWLIWIAAAPSPMEGFESRLCVLKCFIDGGCTSHELDLFRWPSAEPCASHEFDLLRPSFSNEVWNILKPCAERRRWCLPSVGIGEDPGPSSSGGGFCSS